MFLWWPNLDSDIETIVKDCSQCQSNRSMPTAVPIKPWKWPSTPWSRRHLDFAGPFLGHMFLIIIDAYSKWLEVRIMKDSQTTYRSHTPQTCVPILDERNQDTTDETPLVDPQFNQPSLEPSDSSPSVNSPPDTSSDQSSSTELTTQHYHKRIHKPPDCFVPKL